MLPLPEGKDEEEINVPVTGQEVRELDGKSYFPFILPQISALISLSQLRKRMSCLRSTVSRLLRIRSSMRKRWHICGSWESTVRSCILCWIEPENREGGRRFERKDRS